MAQKIGCFSMQLFWDLLESCPIRPYSKSTRNHGTSCLLCDGSLHWKAKKMVAHQAVVWSSNCDCHPPNPDCDESFRYQVTSFSTRYSLNHHLDAKQSPLSPVDWSFLQMGVSENSGTPKSCILIGFSIINHPFWGTSIFGNTKIELQWLCDFSCFWDTIAASPEPESKPLIDYFQSGRYIYFRYGLPSSQYGDISKWCITYICSRMG